MATTNERMIGIGYHDVEFVAGEAMGAYRLVINTGATTASSDNETAEYPAAQYDWSVGITQHACSSGDLVRVRVFGTSLLQVDGGAANIAIGDGLTNHDATGYGQKAAGAASRPVIAQALKASTADGDIIPVLICRYLTTA